MSAVRVANSSTALHLKVQCKNLHIRPRILSKIADVWEQFWYFYHLKCFFYVFFLKICVASILQWSTVVAIEQAPHPVFYLKTFQQHQSVQLILGFCCRYQAGMSQSKKSNFPTCQLPTVRCGASSMATYADKHSSFRQELIYFILLHDSIVKLFILKGFFFSIFLVVNVFFF